MRKITRLLKNLRKIQHGFPKPGLIYISVETQVNPSQCFWTLLFFSVVRGSLVVPFSVTGCAALDLGGSRPRSLPLWQRSPFFPSQVSLLGLRLLVLTFNLPTWSLMEHLLVEVLGIYPHCLSSHTPELPTEPSFSDLAIASLLLLGVPLPLAQKRMWVSLSWN